MTNYAELRSTKNFGTRKHEDVPSAVRRVLNMPKEHATCWAVWEVYEGDETLMFAAGDFLAMKEYIEYFN